jgi:hypothetical protein
MSDKERYELRFVIDELFTALDNWVSLRRQLEREIMETALLSDAPCIKENAFNNANERCERALYNVLSLAGWAPRIWRLEQEHEKRVALERMLSDLSNMDHLCTLVHMADSTTTMDTDRLDTEVTKE